MPISRLLLSACLVAVAWLPLRADAQALPSEWPQVDPLAVIGAAGDVLMRAPDGEVDRFFQAVHASARSDQEAPALCTLFDPGGDRSVAGIQRVVANLGPESRQRFADAMSGIALAGLRNPPQPYDAQAAQQVVKAAGATAMFLHEGFSAGMAADGSDPESARLRCQSFRWLVGALDGFEVGERAAATRYLLLEGLDQIGASF